MKKFLRHSFRKKPSEKQDSEKNNPVTDYARYSNIIYLLIGSVAFSFAAGYLLDWLFNFSFPVFKLIFSFGGVLLGLYLVFKELNRK
ncbi:MAG: AtpZ/AtpI family protein [Chitinophagales bacterium]|nr:AtpZ/AtpI family protein [Chitinophagales bacterium]